MSHLWADRARRSASSMTRYRSFEASVDGFRYSTDRESLLSGPAPKVQNYPRATPEHLVGDPDHASFDDVPPAFRVAVPEERGHPFVGRQAEDAALLRDPSCEGRLARTWQARREVENRGGTHALDSGSRTSHEAMRFAAVGLAAAVEADVAVGQELVGESWVVEAVVVPVAGESAVGEVGVAAF